MAITNAGEGAVTQLHMEQPVDRQVTQPRRSGPIPKDIQAVEAYPDMVLIHGGDEIKRSALATNAS